MRMAALQRTLPHADVDARAAALFAAFEPEAKGSSSQIRSAALADLARLRSCAVSLASAWLLARPGLAEVTAVEFCISARLRLGEDLVAGLDGDLACVCGRSMAATGTHSLICSALWHTVVARHDNMAEACLRTARRGSIAATREPHVNKLPQRLRAAGLPVLPARPQTAPSGSGQLPTCTTSPAPSGPSPTPASALPSTLHVTQVPSAPPPPPAHASATRRHRPCRYCVRRHSARHCRVRRRGARRSRSHRSTHRRRSGRHCCRRPFISHPRTHACPRRCRCCRRAHHRHVAAAAALPACSTAR